MGVRLKNIWKRKDGESDMADMMTFPDTVEEFMEQYKMIDKEQIYSNGIEYVPIFRMRQWFEHLKNKADVPDKDIGKCSEIPNSSETIYRQAAIDALDEICDRGRETHEGRTDRC